MSTVIPEQKCWFCGIVQDRVTNLDDDKQKPEPGDYNVCVNCAAPGVFTPDLTVRQPTDKEVLEFFLDDNCNKQWITLIAFLAAEGKKVDEMWNIGDKPLV